MGSSPTGPTKRARNRHSETPGDHSTGFVVFTPSEATAASRPTTPQKRRILATIVADTIEPKPTNQGGFLPTSSSSASTHERIIVSAAKLFATQGYAATSIGDITSDLGMTKGALYFHFRSKADLAEAIARRYFESWAPILDDARCNGTRGLDTLRWISFQVAHAYQQDVVVRAAVRLWREAKEIDAELPVPFVDWIATTEGFLQEERVDGRLVEGLDVSRTAWQIVASFFGTQDVSNQLADRRDLDDRLTTMWQIILHGVRVPSSD